MPRGDNAATNPHHNNNSRMFEDTPRCKLHERLPAPQSQRISRVPPSLPPHARSYHSPKDSPHINRRLRATTTHNLSKPAQLRRPGTHSRRGSQRSTCSCRTRETSRSTSTGRVIGQSKSPSCSVAQARLLGVLKAWCLARGGVVGLLRLLGAVGWHVHGSHSRGVG
jgi:hypothetical protein